MNLNRTILKLQNNKSMNEIKIKLLNNKAKVPQKSTTEAACYDLVITDIEYIKESYDRISQVICSFGISMTPPEGYKIELAPRSSFSKTKWVLSNSPGQGDRDYQGEYKAIFNAIPTNIKNSILIYDKFPYEVGDRAIQMWLSKVNDISFNEVDELSKIESNRIGGFGSTGNK